MAGLARSDDGVPRGLSASVTKLYLVRAAWGRSAVRPGADRRRASSVHSGKPDSSAGSTTEDDDDDAADDEVADWRIETFEMSLLGGAPPAKLLRSIEVVVLVSSAQTFLWQGNHSTVFQRWAGLRLARLFSTEGSFGVCRVMEGAESALFCSHFVLPQPSSLTAQLEVLAPLPAPLPGGETFPGLSEQVAELHRGKRLQGISTAELGTWWCGRSQSVRSLCE